MLDVNSNPWTPLRESLTVAPLWSGCLLKKVKFAELLERNGHLQVAAARITHLSHALALDADAS